MVSFPEEPPPCAPKSEAGDVMGELRRQLDAVRARLSEHRDQMHAAGLSAPDHEPDPAD